MSSSIITYAIAFSRYMSVPGLNFRWRSAYLAVGVVLGSATITLTLSG